MSLCFRGLRNGFGNVFLFAGAFFVAFSIGYLASPRRIEQCSPMSDVRVRPSLETESQFAMKCSAGPGPECFNELERREFLLIREQAIKSGNAALQILKKPHAVYTDEARRKKIEGKVLLRVYFDGYGNVEDVKVISGLSDGLTEAAITAAKKIEFVPAVKNGRTIPVNKAIEYTFSID